ncbi:MAG: RagB/SusD family nutrient uptake outer membrane protein [Bacteroidota bacterium]
MSSYHQPLLQLAMLVVLLLGAACNEDEFLDRTPFGGYTVNNFFETESQITEAVTACYALARGMYNGALWQANEFRSDNTTLQYNPNDRGGQATEEIDFFVLNSSSPIHGNIYNNVYSGISRTNFIIDRIDEAVFTEEANRPTREAEARFFRAFYHFIGVQHFGDIVVLTEPISDDGTSLIGLQRQPVEDAYNQVILPDLAFAIENLPEEWNRTNVGRITKGAAQTLLAKAHFYRRDFTAALPILNDIVASQQYVLQDDFRSIFDPMNENNDEIIWATQFDAGANQGSGFFLNWLPYTSGTDLTDGIFIGSRAGLNMPTNDLIRAYEPNDLRLEASIGFYDEDEEDPDNELVPYIRKFFFPPIPVDGTDTDYPVFRYADVLLMQAEALLEVGGGLPNEVFETLNRLRARAGLPFYFPGNPVPELDLSTTEQLVEAVQRERRLELAFENYRWQDLVRYGTVEEVMVAHGEEQKVTQAFFLDAFPDAYSQIRTLLAIPAEQVFLYNYRQNPGW